MLHICIFLPEMVPYVEQANNLYASSACRPLFVFTEVVPSVDKAEIL